MCDNVASNAALHSKNEEEEEQLHAEECLYAVEMPSIRDRSWLFAIIRGYSLIRGHSLKTSRTRTILDLTHTIMKNACMLGKCRRFVAIR